MDAPFDVARFERSPYIQKLSKQHRNTVLKVAKSIAAGRSIVYKGRTFPLLQRPTVTYQCLLSEGLHDAVKQWCPRASSTHAEFCDTTNGWSTDDPLKRMIKHVRWEVQPEEEKKAAEDSMRRRDMSRLEPGGIKRLKRAWTVGSHTRHNTEETRVSVPFLEAFHKKAANAAHGEWTYELEYAFGDRTRSDVLLRNATLDTFVLVESKQANALHALGQVMHYHDMACASVPGYAVARQIRIVALMKEPTRYVLETVTSRGILVWWPGNNDVLDACFAR